VSRLRATPPRSHARPPRRERPARAGLHRVHPGLPRLPGLEVPWTKLVWKTSEQWSALLARDPRVRLVRQVTTDEVAVQENYFKLMQAFIYRRVR
jgi:hypothetical protein